MLRFNGSLQELLKDKVSVGGKAVRGNKEKTITIPDEGLAQCAGCT